ncbi:MAG: A/G-specific adenine glycosylase [Thermoanaerobaculia bacterium]|nr:A/G-specific adenine glycosylase [Thermoanaerobaculia bacterium]
MDNHSFFRDKLLEWHAGHLRPMPWKGERNPYKVWLSEIILQQTRVEQGLPYYEKFVAAYPTVHHLAAAPEDEVLKNWEGLGYYSRARNLHAAAKYIAGELSGKFPDTYEGIRALKGVGDYTAAAIASFAYDLPYAVLDGNVYRVLARFFGIHTPTDTPAAKKTFAALAAKLLDTAKPGAYNQAIMDFGATHCTPRQAACPSCPLREHCVACQSGMVNALPVKSKTPEKKDRFFAYAVFYHHHHTWVRQRNGKDIWQNLYEFPLIELPALPADPAALPEMLLRHCFPGGAPPGTQIRGISRPYRQTLTHRVVTAVFCEIDLPESLEMVDFQKNILENYQRIEHFKLKKILALPRIIDWFWQEKDVTLRFK